MTYLTMGHDVSGCFGTSLAPGSKYSPITTRMNQGDVARSPRRLRDCLVLLNSSHQAFASGGDVHVEHEISCLKQKFLIEMPLPGL